MLMRILGAAVIALALGQGAQAATVTFGNLADYDLAVGGSKVSETFSGNRLNDGPIAEIEGAFRLRNNRLQQVAGTRRGLQQTTLIFSKAVTSFAATVRSLGNRELAGVLIDGIEVATIPGGSRFFGLTSTTPFTSITFVDNTQPGWNTQFNIDNIRVSEVPLPAGLPLLAAGMTLMFGFGHLARRRAAARV